MKLASAGIVTVNGLSMMLPAPSQVCMTFSSCPLWTTASQVLWKRVPEGAKVDFYEMDNCHGDIIFSTDPASEDEAHKLRKKGKVVSSFLLMEYSQYPTQGIVTQCFDNSDDYRERVDAANITLVENNRLY
ncbi:hypothetical protein PHYBOEH_001787 [Phytophthora boehmeriae]|uniref:Uncharacterized protein n=1 Tax=Phytophthora boehmeriae TaxID=109152 RepID=A0A8T1X6S7_9STRA|nr:hypothetical protein PHYBOEH_001787 [Phytophthora boehmeriae]